MKLSPPFSLGLVLSILGVVLLTYACRRPKRPSSNADADWEDAPPGLRLEGPEVALLPARGDTPNSEYPAVLTVHVCLPSSLWGATERLKLVFEGPDGMRSENTFSALDQPLGMSINRHYEPPSELPPIDLELIERAEKHSGVESSFRANIALLDFLPGTHRYQAHAELDALRSNVIEIEISLAAGSDARP